MKSGARNTVEGRRGRLLVKDAGGMHIEFSHEFPDRSNESFLRFGGVD